MYLPNEGQITYIQAGIQQNVRIDGRKNREKQEIMRPYLLEKSVLLHCNGSAQLIQEYDNIKIYCGIKLEIGNDEKMMISVDSMKRKSITGRRDQNEDRDKLNYIEQIIDQYILENIDKSSLILVEGKKYWKLKIDVFLLNYADESLIDYISSTISKALEDLNIPKLKITHNYLTNEDEFQLIDGEFSKINFKVPTLKTIGQVGQELVNDLTFDEYHSMQKKYLVVLLEDQVIQVETIGEGKVLYYPEDIMRVLEYVKII